MSQFTSKSQRDSSFGISTLDLRARDITLDGHALPIGMVVMTLASGWLQAFISTS